VSGGDAGAHASSERATAREGARRGTRSDSATDTPMIDAMMSSDAATGNLPPYQGSSHTIFSPTKTSTAASP
jgi:hypothetical protein